MSSFFSFTTNRFSFVVCTLLIAMLVSLGGFSEGTAQSQPAITSQTHIAKDGHALLPIVISSQASESERETAKTLATYLEKITGDTFNIHTSSSPLTATTSGIVLGTTEHFATPLAELKTGDPMSTEDYILRTHAEGVLLVGASETALEHATWDFLYRLGYRQFFPGKNWEVVPDSKNLNMAVDVVAHPDYVVRRISPGFGVLRENRVDFNAWSTRNRMGSGLELSTSHAYGKIILKNKAEFEKHPEYLTKPGGDKFCVSNPGLQQLVINYALKAFKENPALQSLSLDPSDGGGWESDSCPDSTIYPSITDRVVTLANIVAEAVEKKFPDKYIGIYAYGYHSPVPTIKLHPRVIPSVATGFIRGGFTLEELTEGWNEKAEKIGIREYYGVYSWDFDLPGRARVANLDYISNTIPDFHAKKARFLIAESSDSWAPHGLGHYLASRLLWDISANVDDLKADFLDKAFGPAQAPMAEFYRLIDGAHAPLISTDLVGRLYRQLDKALKSTSDTAITTRLHELTLYVRYVELYAEMVQAKSDDHKVAFENIMRYAWRIRRTQMVHSIAVWRALPRYQKIKMDTGTDYNVPEDKNPWKSSEPFTTEQVTGFIIDGIKNNPLLDFTPASFSTDLVPAKPLRLNSGKPGHFSLVRGDRDFYTWVQEEPATITLQASAGHSYRDRGDTIFELYPLAETEGRSVAKTGIAPDKERRSVQLKTEFSGLHRINVSDGNSSTVVSWEPGTPTVVESSLDVPTRFAGGRWTMYFYVPKGTKVVGGYRSGVGRLLDADGKPALVFEKENNPGYWSVPVASGQDGKLWQLSSISGQIMLMTVPPYLSRSADELLLPKEVVRKDAMRQ